MLKTMIMTVKDQGGCFKAFKKLIESVCSFTPGIKGLYVGLTASVFRQWVI